MQLLNPRFYYFSGCEASLPASGVASHQSGPVHGAARHEKDHHQCVQGTRQRVARFGLFPIRWKHGRLRPGPINGRGSIRHFPIASQENWVQEDFDLAK